jgi:hypothetical protein
LAQKTLFKNANFSDEKPPTEKDLRAYLNSGDEVKHILQAAIARSKRAGITCEVLLSCMDDCYQEVTSFSNVALRADLDDMLDLGVSMEGKSSTIDSCLQGKKMEQQCIEEQWQMEQKQRASCQVQEHFLTTQQHLQEMVQNDLKWKEPYSHC